MSSGLETNKIVGAILTALLVTVGISHFGAALFGSGEHGEQVLAYPVAGGEAVVPVEPEPAVVVPTVLPLLADASAADGEALFAACRACHTINEGGNNGVGPNLWGVVGADIAAHPDFNYTDALLALEGDWTYDALNRFIHKPGDYAPGTRMTYPGMPSLEDRANLIAYLTTLSSDPLPLPTQDEIDAAVAEQDAAMGGGDTGDGDAALDEGAAAGDGSPDEAAAEAPDDATNGTNESAGEPETSGDPGSEATIEDAPTGDEAGEGSGSEAVDPEAEGAGDGG